MADWRFRRSGWIGRRRPRALWASGVPGRYPADVRVTEGASVKVYSPKDAYDAWQAGQVTIIDVREQHEYDTTRVAGMPLIPMSELIDRIDELPTDKPLVIFCRSGNRSGQITDYLDATGDYGEVANLTGGILAWAADGLPYEGAPPQ